MWLYLLYQLTPKLLDVSIQVLQSKLAMTILTKSEQSLINLIDSPPSTTKPAKYSKYTCRKYISVKSRRKSTRVGTKKCQPLTLYKVFETTVYKTAFKTKRKRGRSFTFDSDSFKIGVDNHASRTISNNINHFITALTPTANTILRGAGGTLTVRGTGTIRWQVLDDNGQTHSFLIKEALYVPDMPHCLLSPQHWAQQSNDDFPRKHGTWCATYADTC